MHYVQGYKVILETDEFINNCLEVSRLMPVFCENTKSFANSIQTQAQDLDQKPPSSSPQVIQGHTETSH